MSINSLGSSRIQMSGLASGLDTEELVKQMSSAAKLKLDTQKQKLQSLQWKQEQYRTISKSISDFKSKYFDYLTPKTNLSSTSLFGTRSVTSSSSALKVSASSGADKGTYNITEIIKQAKSASLEGSARAVNGIRLDFNAQEAQTYTVNVTLDGYSKDVTFTGGADAQATADSFVNALNTTFSSANAVFEMDDDRIIVSNSEYPTLNHYFSIAKASDDSGMQALGLSSTISNKLVASAKLSELCFSDELKGNSFSFEINDVSFSFSKNETLQKVIDTVNQSQAGVTLSFDSIAGSFKMISDTSGAGSTISVSQTAGDLLSSMFGADKISESSSIGSEIIMDNSITGVKPADGEGFGFEEGVSGDIKELINQKIQVTVNGTTKTIGLWGYNSSGVKNDFSKVENVLSQLNTELQKNFGKDTPVFSYDKESSMFTLTSNSLSDEITVEAVADPTGGSEKLLTALGFNSTNNTNIITEDALLSEVFEGSISGTLSFGGGNTVNLDNNTTINDLVNGSNGYLSFEKGAFTLKGVDLAGCDEAGKAFLESIFGESYNYPGVPPTDLITTYDSNGENAIIQVDGNVITSNTNSFTLNGTTLDVSDLAVGVTDITVTTSSDTSNATDAIKSFVEDYNKLIGDLYSQVTTKSNAKDYQPLTDEQKEEMSDKEIELWEEKAKTGLLYQDDTINTFLSKLRNSVSGFSSNGMALSKIGITVSSNYAEHGKLIVDEAAFKKALDNNEQEVMEFFTDASDGISAAIKDSLDSAISTSYSNKGSLVLLAGMDNTTTVVDNTISKQIASYNKLIETLQTRYENEQERYWKQFTELETMMSAYNSQSQWLASQFSS